MTTYAHITGWGMHVPDKILTNAEISKMVDTSDEWIQERSGIKTRRIAGKEDTSASMGAEAAFNALKMAQIHPRDLDLVIVATSTPEHMFPSTASIVQNQIGAVNAGAFDISAACTGFIFALDMATQAIRSGSIKSAIVIGTETLSRIIDWTDRGTCMLFGDGAGAFVLQASEKPGGVISSIMRSDGSGAGLLSVPAGGSAQPASADTIAQGLHFVQMKGREVFRFATRVMAKASQEAIDKAGLKIEDISIFIPHQANKRIIEAAARGLKLPIERFVMNVDKYGNTSTASIPIATVEAFEFGKLNKGDNVVMVGFGSGLTWGAVSLIWTGPLDAEKPVRFGLLSIFVGIRSFLRKLIRWIEGLIWGRWIPK
jgi:3-oxoacyl-[acyl-carrier-protein] synthase-3